MQSAHLGETRLLTTEGSVACGNEYDQWVELPDNSTRINAIRGEEGALKNDPGLSGIILLVKPIGFRNKM